jgi:hypothetical protein
MHTRPLHRWTHSIVWSLVGLGFVLLIASMPARAQNTYTFDLIPTTPQVSAPAGATLGWGYSITNQSTNQWLVITSFASDPLQHGTPTALFDFPILPPLTNFTEPFDQQNGIGLFEFAWDANAPSGFVNLGVFTLTAQWWTGDPLNGGQLIGNADDGLAVYSVAVATGLQFVPLAQPCRAVDTRPGNGGSGPVQGGTSQNFPISSAGSCPDLPSAAAYSMNVSVVPNGPLGYLTVWPAGQPRPLASTLNSLDGRIKANAAIIPAGASGEISVYATNTTNVIVDVNGYFAPVSGSTLAFYPLTPCRVADTRMSNFPQGLGPPFLPGGQERAFPILNATSCNIPSSAAAYSLNFSVVPHGSLFYMTVWPTGENRPTVSTLNDIPGQIIANAAIVTAGATGEVSVYPTNDTDVVIDINGYFAAAGSGGLSLYGVQPCRVIDTRKSGGAFTGTLSPAVDVANAGCAASSSAQAYVFNASVVPVGSLGYLTLWPDGANRPVVSTLNALDGSISSNMAIVPSTNGKVDAFASGITQLILDISSYFAP